VHDGYARVVLTIVAAALVVLVLIEGGWIEGPAAREAREAPAAGRYQYAPVRYGPLGNFLLRFDTATGRLERVRFPAPDVVWEEVGVLAPGQEAKPDPLKAAAPGGGGVSLGGPGLVIPGLQEQLEKLRPQAPPAAAPESPTQPAPATPPPGGGAARP